MERRKIRDEGDARACIAAVKASKLTVKQWARSEGVDGRSLRAWTINLGRGGNSTKAIGPRTRLAKPLGLVELIPSTPRTTATASRYVVRVGAHAVEVDDQFAEGTLRRLVAVLASC
jgi:hypothetical protein